MSTKLKQAITAIKSGNKEIGQRLLAEIIKADPHNENAWLWMSKVIENDEGRQQCLERVLEINPDNQFAQRELAVLQAKLVNPPKPMLSSSNKTSQSKRMLFVTVGTALLLIIVMAINYSVFRGLMARIYFTKGATNFEAGNLEQAILDFDKAIELDPNYAQAYYSRGVTHLSFDNREQAIRDLEHYLELDPHAPHREEMMDRIEEIKSELTP